MRRLRRSLYHASLLSCLATAPTYALTQADVTEHIIIKLQNDQPVTQEVLDRVARELHLPIGLTFIRPLAGNNYIVDMNKSQLQHALAETKKTKFKLFMNVVSTLNSQKAKSIVKYASEDHIYRLPKISSSILFDQDPAKLQSKTWPQLGREHSGYEAQEAAYEKNLGFRLMVPSTVDVTAVLSTGIRDNLALANNDVWEFDIDAGGASAWDTTPSCVSGNACWGTYLAGVVGAKDISDGLGSDLLGAAYDKPFTSIKIYKPDGTATDELIINGVHYAVGDAVTISGRQHTNPYPAQSVVIDASGFGSCTRPLQATFDELRSRAIVFVGSGDMKDDVSLYSPANCMGVFTVTATTATGKIASYANQGNKVLFALPGGELNRATTGFITTTKQGQFVFAEGTALAAATAAGIATNGFAYAREIGVPMTPLLMGNILENSTYSSAEVAPYGGKAIKILSMLEMYKTIAAKLNPGSYTSAFLPADPKHMKLSRSAGTTICPAGSSIPAMSMRDSIRVLDANKGTVASWRVDKKYPLKCMQDKSWGAISIVGSGAETYASYGDGLNVLKFFPPTGFKKQVTINSKLVQCLK